MEVLSDETEEYDRNEKMDILRRVGVQEYRITDWRKKQVEVWLCLTAGRTVLSVRIPAEP